MRPAIRFLLSILFLAVVPQVYSQVLFVATLSGSQETPPDTSKAQGTAWVLLSADAKTLTYGVTYANLSGSFTASHFHVGAPGVGGGVVHAITYNGNTATGTWSGLPDTLVSHLLRGEVYVNVHSTAYPAGEIRGQLLPADGTGFYFSMDGSQETPPTTSGGTGTGWAVLDSVAGSITYNVTIAGLDTTLTAAHFHIAPPGVAGGVVHGVTFVDSSTSGVWTGYPDSVIAKLAKGDVYFNVHSVRYPAGEIRGQLKVSGSIVFAASLDGLQETPPNASMGTGTAWVVLTPDMLDAEYALTYATLSYPRIASHFHVGAPGIAGPVVQAIAFAGPAARTTSGIWRGLPDSIVSDFFKGTMYVNIHSDFYSAGEIRGQLFLQPIGFTAEMDASQETPPTASGATGTAWASLDNTGTQLAYHVTIAGLDTTLTASHIHDAPVGVAGPVVHAITFVDSSSGGAWSGVPPDMVSELMKDNLYFNVHSVKYPGGEIRGQIEFGPFSGTLAGVTEMRQTVPVSFELEQNYPNPFNPSTRIGFKVSQEGPVSLKVYDILGREVATLVNASMKPGAYEATFTAAGLSSGVYFYRLQVGASGKSAGFSAVRKMLLVR